MSLGEQRNEGEFHDVGLALDHAPNVGADGVERLPDPIELLAADLRAGAVGPVGGGHPRLPGRDVVHLPPSARVARRLVRDGWRGMVPSTARWAAGRGDLTRVSGAE